MTTNVPLNYYETLANNPYSDYPCAKHFWNGANITPGIDNLGQADSLITDVIGGTEITVSGSNNMINNDGIKTDINGLTSTLSSGSFTQPGTKSVLFLVLGDMVATASIHNIGSVTNTVGGINMAGGFSKARVGTSVLRGDTGAPVFGNAEEFHAISWVPATETRAYRLESSGVYDGDNGTADVTNKPTSLTIEQVTTWTGMTKWHGSLLLTFDTLPSAELIEEAMRWMYPLWIRGQFVLYPGFKDLT